MLVEDFQDEFLIRFEFGQQAPLRETQATVYDRHGDGLGSFSLLGM